MTSMCQAKNMDNEYFRWQKLLAENMWWRKYDKEIEVGLYFLECSKFNKDVINIILDYVAIYCSNCSNYENPLHFNRFEYISPDRIKYDNIICTFCVSFRSCEMCNNFKEPSEDKKLLCKKCSLIYTEENAKGHKWLRNYSRRLRAGEISEEDNSEN